MEMKSFSHWDTGAKRKCIRTLNVSVCSSLLWGDRHVLSSSSELLPKLERALLASPLLPGFLLLPPDVLQRWASVSGSSSLSVEAQPGSRHVPPLKEPLSLFRSDRGAVVSSGIVCQPSAFLIPANKLPSCRLRACFSRFLASRVC